MSGDAQSPSETELLLALLEVDPWGHADSETGESECHYCGSDICARYGQPPRWEHWASCPWMAVAKAYGKVPEGHHIYVPPQPEPPCQTCGFQRNVDRSNPAFYGPGSTGTLDAHHGHLAREAGFASADEWIYATQQAALRTLERRVIQGLVGMIGRDTPPLP